MALKPEDVETWLPFERQQRYVQHIEGRRGFTPTRARHLIRLWAYAYLHHKGPPYEPINVLDDQLDNAPFFLSHEEACRLFYTDEAQRFYKNGEGSPRSAGLVLDTLAEKNFIRRQRFPGSRTKIQLNIPNDFLLSDKQGSEDVYLADFDRHHDLLAVVEFLKEMYSFENERPSTIERNINRGLRNWAKQYPQGLRVLRCKNNDETIGIIAIAPVSPKSEKNFYLPPKQSIYLSRCSADFPDPIQVAEPGDPNCHIAYIRSWQLQAGQWTRNNILKLIEETKAMLRRMQDDYPELDELHSMSIHPRHEDIGLNLGFRPSSASDASIRWFRMSIKKFLALDNQFALSRFDYDH